MQVKRFNLSTSELKRIKTDLNEKKRSSFILQPQHIHLKGKHELYLDDENSEKIAVLLAQKKECSHYSSYRNLQRWLYRY